MKLKSLLLLPLAILSLAACDDSKSYSELLEDEDKAVNSFLANQKVINEIPCTKWSRCFRRRGSRRRF